MPKWELTFVRTAVYIVESDENPTERFSNLSIEERQKFLVEEDISLADVRKVQS